MAIVNNNGTFNTGRDCQVILIHSQLGRLDLGNVTGFQAAQMNAQITSDRLDGVQLNADLPKGWSGSFDMDRANAGLDDVFTQIEALWLDQGVYGTSKIYQIITEANGQTTYQYDNASIRLDDAGRYQGDQIVKQRISFRANRRRRV